MPNRVIAFEETPDQLKLFTIGKTRSSGSIEIEEKLAPVTITVRGGTVAEDTLMRALALGEWDHFEMPGDLPCRARVVAASLVPAGVAFQIERKPYGAP